MQKAQELLRKITNRPSPSDEPPQRLAAMLLGPFERELAGARRVYLSPDVALSQMPFAQLPFGEARYRIEVQDLRIVPTGRSLLRDQARRPAQGLLAIGGVDFDDRADESIQVASRGAPVQPASAGFRGAARQVQGALSGFEPLSGSRAEAEESAGVRAGRGERVERLRERGRRKA